MISNIHREMYFIKICQNSSSSGCERLTGRVCNTALRRDEKWRREVTLWIVMYESGDLVSNNNTNVQSLVFTLRYHNRGGRVKSRVWSGDLFVYWVPPLVSAEGVVWLWYSRCSIPCSCLPPPLPVTQILRFPVLAADGQTAVIIITIINTLCLSPSYSLSQSTLYTGACWLLTTAGPADHCRPVTAWHRPPDSSCLGRASQLTDCGPTALRCTGALYCTVCTLHMCHSTQILIITGLLNILNIDLLCSSETRSSPDRSPPSSTRPTAPGPCSSSW